VGILAGKHFYPLPIPHYQEPYHLFQPSNPDLHPHTESKIAAIALSASELAPVIPKNDEKLRPLPKGVMGAVTNKQYQDLILETNPPVALYSLSDVVNFRSQFKDDKF